MWVCRADTDLRSHFSELRVAVSENCCNCRKSRVLLYQPNRLTRVQFICATGAALSVLLSRWSSHRFFLRPLAQWSRTSTWADNPLETRLPFRTNAETDRLSVHVHRLTSSVSLWCSSGCFEFLGAWNFGLRSVHFPAWTFEIKTELYNRVSVNKPSDYVNGLRRSQLCGRPENCQRPTFIFNGEVAVWVLRRVMNFDGRGCRWRGEGRCAIVATARICFRSVARPIRTFATDWLFQKVPREHGGVEVRSSHFADFGCLRVEANVSRTQKRGQR